jgi:hypothetical protein
MLLIGVYSMRYYALALIAMIIVGCGGGGSAGTPASDTPDTVPVPPPPPPAPVTCTVTLSWVNPTLNVNGWDLAPDELTHATLYAAAIPYAPQVWEWMDEIPVYGLTWTIQDVPAGEWYYELTVSNEGGESDPAFTERTCE